MNPRRSLIALAAASLLAVAAAPAASAGKTPPLPARLALLLQRFAHANPSFPGVALAVSAPGLDWTGAAGLSDRAARTPLRPDAGLRIASVTKTFTAAAILRLAEEGKLSLDDPVVRHLGAKSLAILRRGGYDPGAIRVRQLLQHTSGLYDYAESAAYQSYVVAHPGHRWSRDEQVRFAMRHGKPLAAPGREFHYADTGYVLLGEILERTTGHGLAQAYRTLLRFDRLGLDHTYLETLEAAPAGTPARAHQYFGTVDMTRADPSFDLYGGGGLVSTVGDLDRFYGALLGGRVFAKPATLRTMLGNPRLPGVRGLGLGIFGESIGHELCWHHDGFWGTTVVDCPRARVTIAITVNQAADFDAATQRLETQVLALVRALLPR
jgi:D-alanyl-D-alanine carboxypeptidase